MLNFIKSHKKRILLASLLLSAFFFGAFMMFSSSASAQVVSLDLDSPTNNGTATGRIIQMTLIMTVLSLAPSILVMMTSFTRIVIVFSILRHALATNTAPPNTVVVSLALFMTMFIMGPTFQESWDKGVRPIMEEKVELMPGLEAAIKPIHKFMVINTRKKDIALFMDLSKSPTVDSPDDIPLQVITPAFMISELRRAFEIGFLIFVPFIIIDMVIASVLMSMGMMMLPPTMLAMPFKLIFFVLIDGWYLLTGSLVKSFAT